MSLSSSSLAFEDVRQLLDKAIASPNGIRVRTETPGKAIYLAQRCNKFRSDDRKRMRKIYPEDDPKFGTTIYDVLSISKELGETEGWVVIRKAEALEFDVEEL